MVVVPKIEDAILFLVLSLATAPAAGRLAFVAALPGLSPLLTAALATAAPAFAPFLRLVLPCPRSEVGKYVVLLAFRRLVLPCPRSEAGKYVVLLASDKRPTGRSVIAPIVNDAPARFNCFYV